jgi:hypothetical protein
MIITNKHSLPEAIIEAVRNHEHKGGTYSASMLSMSPRQVWLERRHDSEITVDVIERLWALEGTAMHKILEMGAGAHDLGEQFIEIEIFPGVTISGTADGYNGQDKVIRDYKRTSVWTIVYMSRIKDWTAQLNTYGWLFRKIGFEVEHLQIIAFLRDWQKTKAKLDPNYPQVHAAVVNLPLWNEEMQLKYITSRVGLFEANKDVPDAELPTCTKEERWQDEDKYAVMKKGNKRAIRVFDSPTDAERLWKEKGEGHYVDKRPGEPRKCADYCPAAPFCNQFQDELKAGPEPLEETA